jgi:hypothetical protein
LYNYVMLVIGIISLLLWTCYLVFSYFFVNQAILLMMSPVYPKAEKLFSLINLANTNREVMTFIWVGLMGLLVVIQFFVFFKKNGLRWNKKVLIILMLIFIMASLSYPLFSNDIFNYLFGAKTVVYYHQNPFLVMPQNFFDNDLWLRFTHNIDNVYYYIKGVPITYFYGPFFLLYTLIPFLFFGAVEFQKLFWSYKLMGAVLFLITGYLFREINRKDNLVWAYWFFNPFLILELLTNSHNDLVMIFLFVLAVYWWERNKGLGLFSFLLSVLTKWISVGLGLVFFFKEKHRYMVYKLIGLGILFLNAYYQRHAWYYSWIYMVFPFAKLKKSSWFWILVFQTILVFNYTSIIRLNTLVFNGWLNILKWILPLIIFINEFDLISRFKKNLNRRKIGTI